MELVWQAGDRNFFESSRIQNTHISDDGILSLNSASSSITAGWRRFTKWPWITSKTSYTPATHEHYDSWFDYPHRYNGHAPKWCILHHPFTHLYRWSPNVCSCSTRCFVWWLVCQKSGKENIKENIQESFSNFIFIPSLPLSINTKFTHRLNHFTTMQRKSAAISTGPPHYHFSLRSIFIQS